MNRFKQQVWELVEVTFDPEDHAPIFDWCDASLATLIILNVLAVILASVKPIGSQFSSFFWAFEVFSIAVFTVEYVLRIWACTVDSRYSRPVLGRLKYALTPMVLIDLLSFAPFYLSFPPFSLPTPVDLRWLRILRLIRLLRVLKLGRYSTSLTLVVHVLNRKRSDLVAALIVLLVTLVLASSAMYYLENEAQPEVFSSIPASMWWVLSTFTPPSTGNVYPTTRWGQIVGAFIAILGVGIFALLRVFSRRGLLRNGSDAPDQGASLRITNWVDGIAILGSGDPDNAL